MAKTVDQSSISAPATLNYTITVTNTGTVGLTGITVVDVFAGGAVYSSGDTDGDNVLDLTETWIYTADYTATQGDIDAGNNLVNIVRVTSNEVRTPVTAQAVTTITGTAALNVTKTVDQSSISAPATLNYTITVTNTGTFGLTGIRVVDVFAGGAVYSSGDTDRDNILDLNETWIYTADYAATQANIDAGTSLVNVVRVTSNEVTTPVTAQAVTTIARDASLTVEKTQISTDPITAAGQVITYRIIIRNTGNISLTGCIATEIYPGTGLGTLSPVIESISPNRILDVGETWTHTATYTVTQTDIDRGLDLVNTISIFANEYPGPTEDTVTTPVAGTPALTVDKVRTGSAQITAPGQVITYRISVRNTGTISITNVNPTEIYPGDGIGTLSGPAESISSNGILNINETWTYTATYTVTQDDLDNNESLINTIEIRTTQVPGPTTDTEVTLLTRRPGISITKASTSTTFTAPGEVISYTLNIRNTGNVTLTGIEVTDPNAVVTCNGAPYTLAPGAQVTCTAVHTVTSADVTAGRITNIATAAGFGPGTNPVSSPSNEVTVSLNNLPPVISCPEPIVTYTSASTCDILISGGLAAVYSDPNDNIASLTWVMTGATSGESPLTGINNMTSNTFNLGVTTVTYTVTDAFGLSATCSFTVTVTDNVPPTAICQNISVDLDINSGTVSITSDDIDNGSRDNCGIASMAIDIDHFDCTNIGPNIVTLTVTDNSGNTGTCTSTVTVNYAVTPVVTPLTDIICDGETTRIVLSSDIPATSWTWTVNASPQISGASADNSGTLSSINQTLLNSDIIAHNVIYNITPRVYGLCDIPAIPAEVWVNPEPEIRISSPETLICEGESTVISVQNPNTFVLGQWMYDLTVIPDAGITGNTVSGTYTSPVNLTETLFNNNIVRSKVIYRFTPRIVPDDGGSICVGPEETITIWVHPGIRYTSELSDYNGFNISCYGKSDGYIMIEPSPNSAPYTFRWSGPDGFSASTSNISRLSAGQYTMLITDRNGCTVTETFDLIEPARLSMTIGTSISHDGNFNIDCYGAKTGFVNLSAVNGVGSVDYLWTDGFREGSRPNMSAGNYRIIITDSNNCRADSTVTLTEPDPIRITFDVTQPYCPEKPEGEIRSAVTGGISGSYTYLWSDNSTQSVISNIPAGTYRLTVTDMNGCTEEDSQQLNGVNYYCLVIPDAISPNDDGINDVWHLGELQLYPDIEVTIYNRWGQMIWQSERGYPVPWDGSSRGEELPVDSYHFVIDLHNGLKPIIGDVTIVIQ